MKPTGISHNTLQCQADLTKTTIRHLCHCSNLMLLCSLKQQTVSISSSRGSFVILLLLNWLLQGCLGDLRSDLWNHWILICNLGKRNGIKHSKVVSNKTGPKMLNHCNKCIIWCPATQPSAELNLGDWLPASETLNYYFNSRVWILVWSQLPLQRASQTLSWPHCLDLLSLCIHSPSPQVWLFPPQFSHADLLLIPLLKIFVSGSQILADRSAAMLCADCSWQVD